MFHRLTVAQWTDRCAHRLGELLPRMKPSDATRLAVALQGDAYEYQPEDAAAICALELPPWDKRPLSDYSSAPPSSWVLAFTLDEATDLERHRALAVAQFVLDARNVTPFEAMAAEHTRGGWDVSDVVEEKHPGEAVDRAQDALDAAFQAAHDAIDPKWPPDRPRGELVARWPSKVRFEAARERWIARQTKGI